MGPAPRPIGFTVDGNDCFVVANHHTNTGYPRKSIGGKMFYLNRLIFEECFGPIPDGLCVCHKCDNPSCINPEHLFLGTQLENIKDRDRKGRTVNPPALNGEFHPNHKLTNESVLNIRNDSRPHEIIAREYGINKHYVCDIKKRRAWRHMQ
jgi:hypothetical protein